MKYRDDNGDNVECTSNDTIDQALLWENELGISQSKNTSLYDSIGKLH